MSSIHHFYLTFNPFLNQNYEKGYSQCHEFFDFLKDGLNKDRGASAYWGKIISKDRKAEVDIEAFQKIIIDNKTQNLSTHLYITDFQNIWVGKVKSVSSTLPKNASTLPFYTDKNVEVWFEIEDFFLLEHDNEETAKKLAEFYIDNAYSSMKVNGLSPFTTSVKYPCIIQDIAEEQYFDELDEKDTHLIFKNNPAVIKSTSSVVLKSIHLYVFPEEMYNKLPHAAKLEIEAAEMDMLESRHHNLHQMTFSYLKALEIVLNDLVIHHIKRKGLADEFFVDASAGSPKLFMNHTKDYYLPLKGFNKNFSVNNLLHFLDRGMTSSTSSGFRQAFADHKQFLNFCAKELEPMIKNNKLIEIRNALAHGDLEDLTFKDAMSVRNIILGCGTTGIIYSCYRTFYPDKFRHLSEVTDLGAKLVEDKKSKLKLVG